WVYGKQFSVHVQMHRIQNELFLIEMIVHISDYIRTCSDISDYILFQLNRNCQIDLLLLMIKYKCALAMIKYKCALTSLTINFTNYCNYLMHFVKIFFTNYCYYLMHFVKIFREIKNKELI
ncbi:hypothetical protein ACJX0J_030733, partial [Zea mays]